MKNLITLLILFIVLGFTGLQGQITQEWAARYISNGNNNDEANSMAVDNSGNVYVTGSSFSSTTGNDYVTIKYDSDGDSVWVRRYNGLGNSNDKAISIAVDNSGNVYVTGFSVISGTDYDYVTIKYNSNGDLLWDKRYNGTGNDDDTPVSLAIDGSGNIYVTGYSISSGAGYDYATIKYNPDGDSLWVRKYNGPANTSDLAKSLTVDNSGNVYVTGHSDGSGLIPNYLTIKYDSNGDSLWVKRYAAGFQGYDIPSSIAVDEAGNVYVTGYITKASGVNGGFEDCATIKYDSNGDVLWLKEYNGPSNNSDRSNSIGVDDSGNVYITGYSYNNGYKILTIKYNLAGIQKWFQIINQDVDPDSPMLIKLDPAGNAYITNRSRSNYYTLKYNQDGDTLWVQEYNGPTDSRDYATAMAIDSTGKVYVTGRSEGNGGNQWDYATVKYDQVGPPPAYELTVSNYNLVTINNPDDAIEFDIYIRHTNSPVVFEYEAGQYTLSFNPNVLTNSIPIDPNDTSLMSYKIVGSDLPLHMQSVNPTIETVSNPPDTVLSLQANVSPGPGNGYQMTGNGLGTKIARMRLWNKTGTLNVDSLRLRWRNSPIAEATKVSAYRLAWSADITTPQTHFINLGILLPIELTSFSSIVNQNDITLNWITGTETNNSGFDIERSIVNGQWSMIDFVQGNGTTSSPKNYSFTDRGLNSGKYNYRLKQIDFNGNFEYFNLSNEVNVGIPDKFDLSQNYPNPFNPSTKINYALPVDGKVSLKLFDVSGREVMTLVNGVQAAGYYTVTFSGANLSSGVYFYRLNSEIYVETKKMSFIK